MPNFKDGHVKSLTENHFIVFTVLADPKTGEDRVSKIVYRLDEANGKIYEETREPKLDLLMCVGCTNIFRDPLHVEYWRQFVNGFTRDCGEVVKVFTQDVLSTVLKREVEVLADQPSPTFPSCTCALSEELDKDADQDTLFDNVLHALRSQSYNKYLKGEVQAEAEVPETPGETVFVATFDIDGEKIREDFPDLPQHVDEHLRVWVRAIRPLHTFIIQNGYQDYRLIDIEHLTILKDPVVVESFRVCPSPPVGDDVAKGLVQLSVNAAIAEARKAQ
eukprot:UN1063